jgi:hypothetical protein
MNEERRAYVETMMEVAEDFPDGAFMGFMEECGIDVEELVEVSEARRREGGPTKEGRDE